MGASSVDLGGVGLIISGDNNIVTNSGNIQGGGTGSVFPIGEVGVRITGNGNTLVLEGGFVSAGGNVPAIEVGGSSNTLEVWAGGYGTITTATSTGTGNIAVFGGATDASLDASTLHSAVPQSGFPGFSAFSLYQKKGISNWTVTGTTAQGDQTVWEVLAGTLTVGPDSNATGAVTNFAADVTVQSGALLDVRVLDGSQASSLTGAVTIENGGLAQVSAGAIVGSVTVKNGGELDFFRPSNNGAATVSGDVEVEGGGTLSVKSNVLPVTTISTVTTLQLYAGSNLNVEIGASSPQIATIDVSNLALNGTINVTGNVASIGNTPYLLISYTTLIHNAATVGTAPSGYTFTISDSGSAIYLNFTTLATDLYWNGTTTTGSSGPVQGGDGTWTALNTVTNWTNTAGTTRVASDPTQVAAFAGTAGTVTVSDASGTVSTKGLKFLTSGYTITGDTLTLASSSGAPQVNVDGASAIATISSAVAGSDGLEKIGAGTLVLSGVNTYTGGTTVSAGTLRVSGSGSLGSGSYSGAISLGSGTVLDYASSAAQTLSGAISGTGGLTVSGTGTLTLSGANTYSGPTSINSGAVVASGGSAIGDTSAVTIASGANLTLSANETVGSLAGAGAVTLTNTSQLTAGGDNSSTTFSGGIVGTGSFEKTGSGTLTLNGASTFIGVVTLSGGSIVLSGGSALPSATELTMSTGRRWN